MASTETDSRQHAERRLTPLQRRALLDRHAAAVPLLKTATLSDRYRILAFVVAPPADVERRQLDEYERDDLERR